LNHRVTKSNLPAAQQKIIKSQMGNNMAGTVKVTLTKSMIGSTGKIRATLVGLGLTRRQKSVVRKDTPEIRGMLRKVGHLIKVEEV
jgi:large subunit ribosomal protein L30